VSCDQGKKAAIGAAAPLLGGRVTHEGSADDAASRGKGLHQCRLVNHRSQSRHVHSTRLVLSLPALVLSEGCHLAEDGDLRVLQREA